MNRCGLGRRLSRGRVLLAFGLLVVAGAAALGLGHGWRPAQASSARSAQTLFAPGKAAVPDRQHIQTAFAQLPLSFEPNQGQTDPQVKFLARGGGYGLFLTSSEAVLSLQARPAGRERSGKTSVVRMQLSGADQSASVTAADPLPGKSSYFIGNDPAKWHSGIPQFARVRYQQVYPGIDLVYYGNQGRLEYDFEVAPGSDPGQIALQFEGADQLALDSSGALLLKTGAGDVNFEAPRIYQQVGNTQKPVAGRFVLRGKNQAGFALGAYDRSRALVIDPVLTYSTYLGGTGAETSPAIAVDLGFNVYVAGTTTSPTFPVQSGGTAPTLNGASDVFIAKLNNNGSALIFSTYVGGSGSETAAGIGIDSGFNVAVGGTTNSTDFPLLNNFDTPTLAAGNHAFVFEVNSSGSAPLYSTYLGGNGNESASGLAVDVKNKIYVTGTTTSTNFPTTTGAFQVTSLATNQFFMAQINPATSGVQSLVYSTYFGGGNPSGGVAIGGGIAVDSSSNVYFTGSTNFAHTGGNLTTDFPILNATQGCLNAPTNPTPCPATTAASPTDIFVAKLNPAAATGAQLQYSTYLGGTSNDSATGIAVDTAGNAYITGFTTSTDWTIPSTETLEPQSANGGGTDAFLAKLGTFTPSTTTTTITGTVPNLYFTYLGGTGEDEGLAVAVDAAGGARVTGYTDSANFPASSDALQAASGGGRDAFFARIDTVSVTPTHYISYLGGSGADRGTGITIDSGQSTYITGDTSSPNFPLAGPLQGTLSGPSDAFVSKFGPTLNLALSHPVTSPSPTPSGVGNAVTFTYTITNNGDLATGIVFTDLLSGSGTLTSATTTSGSCTTATGTPPTVTCSIGTLNAGNETSTTASTVTATVTITVTPTSAGPLGNSGILTVGSAYTTSDSQSANITDFSVAVAPASQTTPAGTPVSYTATVTPTGGFPNTVTLSCSAGLPSGAACTPSSSITNLNTGPKSVSLVVNSTVRTTTTSSVRPSTRPFYATWLPISGLALFGLGAGGKKRRRWLMALLFGAFLTLIALQVGCGSSSTTTTTTGTPAGTYTVSVTATSGSATRTTTMQLIIE